MNKTDTTRLLDVLDDPTFQPQGEVTVEIRNERGKVIDLETKPNFISKTWKTWARARLRWAWMAYATNVQFTGQVLPGVADAMWTAPSSQQGNAASSGGRNTIPIHPASHLACWNDTTAEDSVNEHTPFITPDGLIAWASLYPFAGAGARGAIDSSESALTDLLMRRVFNWTGPQGVGTFQSVGFLQLGAPGVHKAGYGINFRRRFTTGSVVTSTSLLTGAVGIIIGAGFADLTNDKLYFVVKRLTSGGNIRVISIPISGLNDSNANTLGVAADVTVALTNESAEFTPTSIEAVSGSTIGLRVIGRDGTNTIVTYPVTTNESTGTGRWCKVGAAGASTDYVISAGTAAGAMSGAVISGSAYLAASADAAGANIYVHTIATGVLTATRAIDAKVTAICTLLGITTPRVRDIVTDGTDLIVTYTQSANPTNTCAVTFRITTAGVMTQIIGMTPHYQASGAFMETAAAPWASLGTYKYPNNVMLQAGLDTNQYTSYQTNISSEHIDQMQNVANAGGSLGLTDLRYAAGSFTAVPGNGFHVWYDGALHFLTWSPYFFAGAGGGVFTLHAFRQGMDLGSRVLLGAPKVKSSSDFMKITYDIALPGWF